MDIAAWLRGLGLEQYAPAFRANAVDGEVLPDLTADDLIAIGVILAPSTCRAICGNGPTGSIAATCPTAWTAT